MPIAVGHYPFVYDEQLLQVCDSVCSHLIVIDYKYA